MDEQGILAEKETMLCNTNKLGGVEVEVLEISIVDLVAELDAPVYNEFAAEAGVVPADLWQLFLSNPVVTAAPPSAALPPAASSTTALFCRQQYLWTR